ncbi:hypothetical protein CWI42_080620 [Ordospora colligata]|uniref:Uncharacterized protein n=1 Tax=Ordospora colligata OC4 TaxID=1354746 RepID=A0A0B2UJE0_9MICR|nr:uncharacterized protein M896_080630 [Ordospora colligata OC4]KHN69329.1 hypothetical protein M896_080630 [Ordospora colligata OC4]TBU14843.1 hypothetical protein CWI41_080620 [Ordospora colligata]TBU14974.1 hypothetical protein CWI40_080640 [Ordospora colligata]TBU18358.1 hypothetical protein CWI42_080620 [Ordospora colligata]
MEPAEIERMLEQEVCWANAPPAPIPGMCYIDPEIKRDFTSFDASLDHIVPKQLHTDLLDALDIDFMELVMKDMDEVHEKTEECIGTNENKNEIFERERLKIRMSKIFDYQKYIQESFEDVNTIVHPTNKSIKVEAVYDLFPDTNAKSVIVQSACTELTECTFSIEQDESSSLFAKALMTNGKILTCIPQRTDEYIALHVDNDAAYYTSMTTLYQLQEQRKQTKG